MRKNRVTIGDIIVTDKMQGRITKVDIIGGDKKFHVTTPRGGVFQTKEKDIMRIVRRKRI